MKLRIVWLVILTALVIGSAPAVRAAPAGKSASVAHMVLRLSDFSHGYKQTAAHTVTNRETVTSDHSREYITHGRITGYQTAFSNPDAFALTQVTDVVASFKNTSGAHWAVRKAATTGSASVFAGRHLKPMAVRGVGDEAVGFTVTVKAHGISITLDSVVFRVGRYDGSITGAGVTQSFRLSKLLAFAQIMVRRMRSA